LSIDTTERVAGNCDTLFSLQKRFFVSLFLTEDTEKTEEGAKKREMENNTTR